MLKPHQVAVDSPRKVDFQVSLAVDLPVAIDLVRSAHLYEGFHQWVYDTRSALPSDLRDNLEILPHLITDTAVFSRLSPGDLAHRHFSALIAKVTALREEDFRQFVNDALDLRARYCLQERDRGLTVPSLENADEIRAFLRQLEFPDMPEVDLPERHLHRAVRLIRNPAELKARYISVLARFWDQFYRDKFKRNVPLMSRSVDYHRARAYSADFATVFAATTGRVASEHHLASASKAKTVIFAPNCSVGPYVILNEIKEPQPTLVVVYNCRPTGAPEHEATLSVQDLFPPLKALADETRLRILSILNGQELYAQQIVERLGISQPAVSRHLKLMVIGEVLKVRRDGSMKYYSLNEDSLTAVGERLKSFEGPSP
jgi:DNA-binding transcriptional ArsR family regulator